MLCVRQSEKKLAGTPRERLPIALGHGIENHPLKFSEGSHISLENLDQLY